MDVSPEHLVAQARERFQLQDYYGAIHLLEEVVATGRASATIPILRIAWTGSSRPSSGRVVPAREEGGSPSRSTSEAGRACGSIG